MARAIERVAEVRFQAACGPTARDRSAGPRMWLPKGRLIRADVSQIARANQRRPSWTNPDQRAPDCPRRARSSHLGRARGAAFLRPEDHLSVRSRRRHRAPRRLCDRPAVLAHRRNRPVTRSIRRRTGQPGSAARPARCLPVRPGRSRQAGPALSRASAPSQLFRASPAPLRVTATLSNSWRPRATSGRAVVRIIG
jgi:hypothetical protein